MKKNNKVKLFKNYILLSNKMELDNTVLLYIFKTERVVNLIYCVLSVLARLIY